MAHRSPGTARRRGAPLPETVAGLVAQLTSAEARERLLAELPGSAVFGAQFRMNAARALLLPRERVGKRTPLWLSRLRAKDLLQAVAQFDDFPILLETYRDCLRDVMDLDGLTEVLDRIQRGGDRGHGARVRGAPRRWRSGLDYRMAMQYVYEYDAPRGEKQLAALSLNRSLLADLLQDGTLAGVLKPDAVAEVTARVSRTAPGQRARSAEELAQLLYELGDLSDEEIAARCPAPGGEWGRRAGWPGRARGGQLPGVDARPGRRRADRAPSDGQRGVGGAALGARRAPGGDRRPPGAARCRCCAGAWRTAARRRPTDLARRYGLDAETVTAALRSLGERDVACGRFTTEDEEGGGDAGRGLGEPGRSSGSTAGPWSRCTAAR